MECPQCNSNLEGSLIYQTFIELGHSPEQALEYAKGYGASAMEGRWGREIGHYSLEFDRVVEWECPDCHHIWPR